MDGLLGVEPDTVCENGLLLMGGANANEDVVSGAAAACPNENAPNDVEREISPGF